MRENPKEKERVRDRPALYDGIPCKEGPRQEKCSMKRKPATMLRLFKGDCIVENDCAYWHPPRCSFSKTVNCKLGSKCAFKRAEKAGCEPNKQNNSVAVAKTLDISQAEEELALLHFKAKENLKARWKETCEKNSPATFCFKSAGRKATRWLKERDLGNYTTWWAKRSKSERCVV